MPFQKMELHRDVGGGRVSATFTILGPTDRSTSQTLGFEVWFFTHDAVAPLMVVNPSIDLVVSRRTSANGHEPQRVVRLPISVGDLGDSGGLIDRQAMVWRPFAFLPAELVLRLEGLRHPEYGFHVQMKLNAGLVSLATASRRPGEAALPLVAQPFPWHDQFALTNETWRELLAAMGWPTPRAFELHPLSFSTLAEFDEAAERLREAERLLFLGHWGESIGKSRVVIEAVFRKLGYKGKGSYDWKTIVAEGLPGEMADVFRALNNVANHEHHATGADLRWQRADARFLLQLAATLAEYAGTLPSKAST